MVSLTAISRPDAKIATFSVKQICLALLIATTGFDLLSVGSVENRVRVSYVLYLFLFVLLIRHMKVPKIQGILIGLFCVAAFVGMVLLGPSLHSILYIAWVLFSFLIIYPLFYYFGREHRADFLAATVLSARMQILAGVVVVAAGLQHRAALLYYEPSYFAYGLIPYVAITMWRLYTPKARESVLDLFLLLVALVETGSATLLLATGVIWFVASCVNGIKLRQVIGVCSVILAFFLAIVIYAHISNDLLATTVRELLASPNRVETLVQRGGNRIPRLLAAAYIFTDHPWLGVGIGQYRNVSKTVNLSSFSKGSADNSAQNNEAINIYIELLATTGIPTASLFFLFLLRTVMLRRPRELDDGQKAIFIALVSMLLMLNLESNYLRPYLWMLLGAYAGMLKSPLRQTQLVRLLDIAPIAPQSRPAEFSFGVSQAEVN